MTAARSMPDHRPMKIRSLAAPAALALLLAGCGSNSSTSPTSTVTEHFTGTLAAGASDTHTFTVGQDGTVIVTLDSLTPQSSITVGLGLGNYANNTCTLFSYSQSAKVASPESGSLTAGPYCVVIFDVGNVVDSDSYSISVEHL
jgi:hypothetical protein